MPKQTQRPRPLQVGGVGHGSQACDHDISLPVAFTQSNGTRTEGTFTVPIVQNSDLPGLIGLRSMQERKTILDMHTLKIHFLGPGDYDISPILPRGTESYQCELSPSGHIMLPCSRYAEIDREERGPIELVPTTWTEITAPFPVVIPELIPPPAEEGPPPLIDLSSDEGPPPLAGEPPDSSSDGPPGLVDSSSGDLIPRRAHLSGHNTDSSSQDSE